MKKEINLKIALVSLSALAFGCAGPESYQQKMARYTPKNYAAVNQVPIISVEKFDFKNDSKGRMPASVAPMKSTTNEENKESNPTNKKLYFLTILNQYEAFKVYSSSFEAPSINICPSFHTTLLKFNDENKTRSKNTTVKKFQYDSQKLNDPEYLNKNPELFLSLSKEEPTPRVIDLVKNFSTGQEVYLSDLVVKALDIHLTKTYLELATLCEHGASDNYYAYENLITHLKNNEFLADKDNLKILLKTTLFSNMAILTSLEKQQTKQHSIKMGRSLASVENNAKPEKLNEEVLKRLNVSWAKNYLENIKN